MTKRARTDEVTAKIFGTDLLCWYRAETMSSTFGDGQTVDHWLDESGNGAHMSSAQAGVNKPPVMKTNGVNGYASILFDGTDDELRGGFITGAVCYGSFAVVKQTVTGDWDDNAGFLYGQVSGNAGLYGPTGTSTIAAQHAGTNTYYVNGVETNAVDEPGEWNVYYYQSNTADNIAGIVVGNWRVNSNYLNGEIAECGFFAGPPSADVRTAFLNALMARYGIS